MGADGENNQQETTKHDYLTHNHESPSFQGDFTAPKEFAYGKFEKILELPEGVNTEKVNAEFVNGVLEITAPIPAVALPRKIEIKTTTPFTKQIAA